MKRRKKTGWTYTQQHADILTSHLKEEIRKNHGNYGLCVKSIRIRSFKKNTWGVNENITFGFRDKPSGKYYHQMVTCLFDKKELVLREKAQAFIERNCENSNPIVAFSKKYPHGQLCVIVYDW